VNSHSTELIPDTFILNIKKERADRPWISWSNLRPTGDSVGTVFWGPLIQASMSTSCFGSFMYPELIAVSFSSVHVTPTHHLRGLNDRSERLAFQ
jgi:hypothetical protein